MSSRSARQVAPDPIWSLAGALVAGEAYAVLAALRLGALPAWATLALGAAIGCTVAAPFLVLAFLRRLRSQRPPRDGRVPALCRAAALGGATIAVVQAVNFSILERLWAPIGLASMPSKWRLLTIPTLVIVASAIALRLLDRLAAWMVARRAPPGVVFGAAMLPLVIAAELAAPARQPPSALPLLPSELRGISRTVPRRIVLAIDALGAEMLDRFAPRMPALTRFASRSSRGALVAETPVISGRVWTSIATGRPAAENGIEGNFEVHIPNSGFRSFPIDQLFVDPAPGLLLLGALAARNAGLVDVLPATSTHRKGVPFWMETGGDERVVVVCWLATWPPDPVNGVLVTDRWPLLQSDAYWPVRRPPNEVSPERFAAPLAAVRRIAGTPPDPKLVQISGLAPEEWGEVAAGHGRSAIHPLTDPLMGAYYGHLHDTSCLDAAKILHREVGPDLLVIYLDGPDEAGHALLPDPELGLPWFEPELARRLQPVMGNYLAYLDGEISWLLELGDESTVTVVMSDHGLAHDPNNLLFHNWHAKEGFVLARGPGFGPDRPLGTHPSEAWWSLLARAVPPG